jgi:hypothetical protein
MTIRSMACAHYAHMQPQQHLELVMQRAKKYSNLAAMVIVIIRVFGTLPCECEIDRITPMHEKYSVHGRYSVEFDVVSESLR